ncbi:MAG: hypothetical protein P9M14_10130 [Candidatus Alcyoniella australis]|nr:hypothetical protein [Candidatus Alcyoniella australis]
MSELRRVTLWTVASLAACLLLACGLTAYNATAELERAREAQGWQQVAALDRALRWQTPHCGSSDAAADELLKLSDEALERGDSGSALYIARLLRAGLAATRAPGIDHAQRLETARGRVQRIVDRSSWHANAALDAAPLEYGFSRGWSMAASLALYGWIAAFVCMVLRWPVDRSRQRGPALVCGGLFVALFALWVVGLTLC